MKFIDDAFKLIRLLILALVSWVIIHAMAVFGPIIAFAYPIWMLIFPEQEMCLMCRTTKIGNKCFVCGRVREKEVISNPATLRSAFGNALLILVMSAFSIGFVFLEIKIVTIFKNAQVPAEKTAFFVLPAKQDISLGAIFPLDVKITQIKVPVNVVKTDISFDPKTLEVVKVVTDNSFATIFIQNDVDNEAGYIQLIGGVPNPGYVDAAGDFATIYFKAKAPGITKVKYMPTSAVLANDGKGTNVLKDFATIAYFISETPVSESSNAAVMGVMQKRGETESQLASPNSTTRMEFYDVTHDSNNILGAETTKQFTKDFMFNAETPQPKKDIIDRLIDKLVQIDTMILNVWEKLILRKQ